MEKTTKIEGTDDSTELEMVPGVFATMITDNDFGIAIDVLLYSLRKTGTNRDIIVMATPQVSETRKNSWQQMDKVRVVEVEPIPNPSSTSHVEGWINSGYTKLQLWNLTEFSKIVYIDADAIVMEKIDELFDRDADFAAAPDLFPPDHFNAGVMIVKPDNSVFENMMSQIQTVQSYDGGDTGFLNTFFNDWYTRPGDARLPFCYNAQRTLHWLTVNENPGYWRSIGPIKILHFSSNPKPWKTTKKGDLEMIWWECYTMMQIGDFNLEKKF